MNLRSDEPGQISPGPRLGFVTRTLVVLALVATAFLLWQIRMALLISFAAIIIAVLLLAATEPIEKRTPFRHRWVLTGVVVAVVLALAGVTWLIGAQVRGQVVDIVARLPEAWRNFQEQLGFSIPLPELVDGSTAGPARNEDASAIGALTSLARDSAGRIVSFGYTMAEVVTTFVLVVIGGIFLASDPGLYRRGVVGLFPKAQHDLVTQTMGASGRALRKWLLAQLVSMTIVGILTGLGTWLIGLPAPLALGVLAGLAEFVPIVGPILSAIPALLLAVTEGWQMVLWTLLLYVGIQQLESDVITPLVQQRMVEIPAGVLLFAVLAFGLLFGTVGILVASPLAVVTFVAVKKLYANRLLGEETPVPGESES